MKRTRVALAIACLALAAAAAGGLALYADASSERSAARLGAPAAQDVRPTAGLAAPVAEGATATTGRVAVADGARLDAIGVSPASIHADCSPLRTVRFVVHDAAGAPIAGASGSEVFGDQAWGRPSSTDAEGRGEICVMPEASALSLTAVGYESAEVALPPGNDPLAVVLRAAAVLEVRLSSEAAGLGMELRAGEAPFVEYGRGSWMPEAASEASLAAMTHPKGLLRLSASGERIDFLTDPDPESQGSATFWGSTRGIIVLSGVRPGLALDLVVVDAYGFAVLKQSVSPLVAGERRIVELAPELPARRLAGRVSAAGLPVVWAQVSIGPGGHPDMQACMTDARGAFSLEGIAAERVRLTVRHREHAPLLLPELRVTDEPLELALERGRIVRVFVHGPEGDSVPRAGASLSGRLSGLEIDPQETDRDIVFEHASREELALRVTAAGSSIERWIAPGFQDEAVDIEVPAQQSCTVLLADAPGSLHASLTLHLEGDGRVMQRSLGEGERSARFEVLFPGSYQAFAVARIDGKDTRCSEAVAVDIGREAEVTLTLELRAAGESDGDRF